MTRFAARPVTRRHLIRGAAAAAIPGSLPIIRFARAETAGPFSLPPLPYAEDALAPAISGDTIGFHYGKHHRAYIDNLNKLVQGAELAGKSLEDIVKTTRGNANRGPFFNNAAQAWNHTFYWNSMRPNGGGPPAGVVADRIKDSFGDLAKFRQEFATAASVNSAAAGRGLCRVPIRNCRWSRLAMPTRRWRRALIVC